MSWYYNYPPELYHHGILGQKWGVRRYQYSDGSLTPAGRKRYRVNEKGDLVRKTKAEMRIDNKKAKAEALEKKRQVRLEREREDEEKKKERIANSRDPELIYKNKDLFDYRELNDLYQIMNVEKNIKGLIPRQVSKGEKYIKSMEQLEKGLGKTAGALEKGSKIYDVVAKTMNAFADAEMPVINTGDGGDSKKKKKKTYD